MDRLESNSKINTGEKLWLKDVIENDAGEPKIENIPEYLKIVHILVDQNQEVHNLEIEES